jgi:hypothetical protein
VSNTDDRHPGDEWVEVTMFGDTVPTFMLAVDGREAEIERAKRLYVHGAIQVDELERCVESALTFSRTAP